MAAHMLGLRVSSGCLQHSAELLVRHISQLACYAVLLAVLAFVYCCLYAREFFVQPSSAAPFSAALVQPRVAAPAALHLHRQIALLEGPAAQQCGLCVVSSGCCGFWNCSLQGMVAGGCSSVCAARTACRLLISCCGASRRCFAFMG
jgi:hypothetical protein